MLTLVGVALASALSLRADVGARYGRLLELRAAVPPLDRELAWHACLDDEGTWRAFGRRVGPRPLLDAYRVLSVEGGSRTFPEFVRDRQMFGHFTLRVSELLESEFDYPTPAWYTRRNLRRSVRQDFELSQLRLSIGRTVGDSNLTPQSRLAALDSLIERFRGLDDLAGIESVHLAAAQIELEVGHPEQFRARLQAALSMARRLQDHFLVCQLLGQFASMHTQAGREDSTNICIREGLALARRHGFPDQTSRFMVFDATRAIARGQLALAADRLLEAQELVEEFGGGSARMRLLLLQATLLADLGCWDLVERSLRRLPVLLRESQPRVSSQESSKSAYDADLLRARVAFARGDVPRGEALLAPWLRDMPVWNRRVGFASAYDVWSEGLMRSGRWEEAVRVCERGLAHSDSSHAGQSAVPMALRHARALEALGRLDAAKLAASDAARRVLEMDGPDSDGWRRALAVLQARLCLRAGDREAGRALLRRVIADLRRKRIAPEATDSRGPETRTGLSVRSAVHELAGLSPAAGYGFEMGWRSLRRRHTEGDPFAGGRHEGDGVHFVYYFLSDRALRWTADSSGIRLDTLAVRPERCLEDVREVVKLLRTEAPAPGQWLEPRSARLLRRLAGQLLPGGLLAAGPGIPRVAISPDGPLLALPFEALIVASARGERPLAAVADVCYEAGWSARSRNRPGAAVVVSNPDFPAGFGRHHAWSGSLLGSVAESECARARWPDAIVLRGRDATKSRVLQAARNTAYLYIASHHVRDPGAPFLGFLPLAADSGAATSGSLLESAEIRALDLSACRLAVLASCASGAPYRVGEQPGPNLGDAFLDAGSHAVVRSFWDVGDDDTHRFMARFLAANRRTGESVRALNAVRREAMAEGAGVPPRVWAAWSVAETWDDDRGRDRGAVAGGGSSPRPGRDPVATRR